MSKSNDLTPSRSVSRTNSFLAMTALIVSLLSLAVSTVGVYYARSQSPFHFAQPHQLSFWTIKSNTLTEDQKPRSGRLVVRIKNDSETPAREVLIVISPISMEPKIGCNATFSIQDGGNGTKLLKVDRVPAKSTIDVSVNDSVTEYPENRSSHGYYRTTAFAYSADVYEVQTEFGVIKKDHNQCEENYSFLPDDKREFSLEEMRKKLRI